MTLFDSYRPALLGRMVLCGAIVFALASCSDDESAQSADSPTSTSAKNESSGSNGTTAPGQGEESDVTTTEAPPATDPSPVVTAAPGQFSARIEPLLIAVEGADSFCSLAPALKQLGELQSPGTAEEAAAGAKLLSAMFAKVAAYPPPGVELDLDALKKGAESLTGVEAAGDPETTMAEVNIAMGETGALSFSRAVEASANC